MEFKLPELGEGVHEGELVKWRVTPGSTVKDDQPLCDVMTDKATIEIPSPFSGVVESLEAKEGQTVKVGQVLVKYQGSGSTQAKAVASAPVVSAPVPKVDVTPAALSQASSRVAAAPSTRKLAREMGVDLGTIQGTGPSGRILRSDLQHPTDTQTLKRPLSRGEERIAFKGLRKKIAEKMRQSVDHAAHFTFVEEANATELVKLRTQAKEIGVKQGVKVTYLPFIMKAMVSALRQFPIVNSSLDETKGEIVLKHYFNISLSVQTDDGLVAPVVKDVEHKTILELARDIQTLVDKARTKKLTLDDLQGGTITLTNAGSIGGLFTTPVINYPEVAILGFNKISKKAVVQTIGGVDKIAIRDWTYFSITLDHRIVDGAIAAEFMKTFIRYVETPSLLILDSF